MQRDSFAMSRAEFTRRTLIVFAIAAGLFLAWRLAGILLLVFGGVVFAVIIRAAGDQLARLLPLPRKWAALLVMIALMIAALIGGYLIGDTLTQQFSELLLRLPAALEQLRSVLEGSAPGRYLLSTLGSSEDGGSAVARLAGAASATLGALADLILVLFLTIYFSLNPQLYTGGLVSLLPRTRHERAKELLEGAEDNLRGWLIGKLVAMSAVGVLTGLTLWLLKVPAPLALGVIAGLLDFVPIIGPIVAAVPGILLALTVGPDLALYTALAYLVIQQAEGNVITPLAQQWAVSLPPALSLLAIVIFGVLFGIPGVLFGTPLMVVLVYLVRALR